MSFWVGVQPALADTMRGQCRGGDRCRVGATSSRIAFGGIIRQTTGARAWLPLLHRKWKVKASSGCATIPDQSFLFEMGHLRRGQCRCGQRRPGHGCGFRVRSPREVRTWRGKLAFKYVDLTIVLRRGMGGLLPVRGVQLSAL